MICPDCGEGLELRHVRGVEVDHCPRCGGGWFDAGELRRAGPRIEGAEVAPSFSPMNVPAGRCPRCTPEALLAGYIGVVSVSRCSVCLGIWVPKPIRTARDQRERNEALLALLEIATDFLGFLA